MNEISSQRPLRQKTIGILGGMSNQATGEYYRMLDANGEPIRGDRTINPAETEVIRSLIEAIILTPSDKGIQIDVRGDLAGILTVASGSGQTKTPVRYGTGARDTLASQVQTVAGGAQAPIPTFSSGCNMIRQ